MLLIETRGQEQWVMSTFLELDHDLLLKDLNLSRRLHKVTKQMTGGCRLISLSDLRPQESIEAAGHQRELQITIDLHGHGGRESVHMKEVDPVRNPILDDHPLGIALDQLRPASGGSGW